LVKKRAEVLSGGSAGNHEGDTANGYYIQPTILKGNNKMRVFQEEIFGPVVALTTFSSTEEAIEIANDTIWFRCRSLSRDAHELFPSTKSNSSR
jgi:aldehyde dehydrogenase (NAD+)/aldehyde dehydrogenase